MAWSMKSLTAKCAKAKCVRYIRVLKRGTCSCMSPFCFCSPLRQTGKYTKSICISATGIPGASTQSHSPCKRKHFHHFLGQHQAARLAARSVAHTGERIDRHLEEFLARHHKQQVIGGEAEGWNLTSAVAPQICIRVGPSSPVACG
jgi:hypothetical protein